MAALIYFSVLCRPAGLQPVSLKIPGSPWVLVDLKRAKKSASRNVTPHDPVTFNPSSPYFLSPPSSMQHGPRPSSPLFCQIKIVEPLWPQIPTIRDASHQSPAQNRLKIGIVFGGREDLPEPLGACAVAIGLGESAPLTARHTVQASIEEGEEDVVFRRSTDLYPVDLPDSCIAPHLLGGYPIFNRGGRLPPLTPWGQELVGLVNGLFVSASILIHDRLPILGAAHPW